MKTTNISQDVSSVKLTQVEEQYKFMAMSVQQSSEGMAYSDLDGNLIFINKAWYEMHGYKSDKYLLGKNLAIFHNKKQMKDDVIPFNKIVMKNGSNSGEVGHITKDGKVFPTLMTVTLLKDANGNPFALAGIAKDITERKEVEQELKNSEILLKESQKVANLGTYVLDIPSGIWESSKILENIFGINKKYKKDVNAWIQIVHPDDKDMMQDYFATNVLTNKEFFNKEYRIKRINDQQDCWVHGMGKLELNDDGEPIKMLGTIQDITKRKQAEEKLKSRNKELELFNEVTVNRELKMIDLKKEINELLKNSGKNSKYKIPI